MKTRRIAISLLIFSLTASAALAGPAFTDPEKTDADFAIQGEYAGTIQGTNGPKVLAVQVIALGKGNFQAVGYVGGLPGQEGHEPGVKERVEGKLEEGAVKFTGSNSDGILKDGVITVMREGAELGKLMKVDRKSPTLGEKPPAGAVVLFDGSSADAFSGGKIEEGLLVQGVTSKQKFGSHRLHVEFRLPYMPEDRGQGRGNSGLYLQGRYEVQMLDSFGLEGKHNECGGIYSVKDPDVNMAFPPLSWQTYDVDYTAAQYDDSGKLTAAPRVTVRHNGVVIHNDVELPGDRNTTAAPVKAGPESGPVYLQNHGNPVRYRNIWVVEK